MYIKSAEFVISVADAEKIPNYEMPDIAIAGKSNVGKSSFINFVTNTKGLARTSGEPGRTRLINYFLINKNFYLVDLPGYGYARVSDDEKRKWAKLTDKYFEGKNLRHIFVLLDIRHEPNENDKQLIGFLYAKNIPFSIVATKSDKLSTLQQKAAIRTISSSLGVGEGNVLTVSSLKKTGLDGIDAKLKQILG